MNWRFTNAAAVLLTYMSLPAVADNATLRGIVMDKITSQPIPDAAISAAGNLALKDEVSNSDGDFYLQFSQTVRPGQILRVSVRKDGYRPYDKEMQISSQLIENIFLTPLIKPPSLRSQQPPQEDPAIYVNYLRLFGAQQAPLILASMYLAQTPGDETFTGRTLDGVGWDPTIAHFWETWEYRKALPIRSLVWNGLFEHGVDTQTNLLRAACTGDNAAMAYEVFDPLGQNCGSGMAGHASNVCPPDAPYSESEVLTAVRKRSLEIGFLAVIVENTSGSMLRDLKFQFRQWRKPSELNLPFEKADVVEHQLSQANEETLSLPGIRAHASVLWLLSVYRKDAHGFPESYVSSVIRPTQVSFLSQGQRITVPIRKPLLDKALTVSVPYGWFYQ
jgi:hypothetical protein